MRNVSVLVYIHAHIRQLATYLAHRYRADGGRIRRHQFGIASKIVQLLMAYRFDFYIYREAVEGVRAIILLINVFELLVLIFFFRISMAKGGGLKVLGVVLIRNKLNF